MSLKLYGHPISLCTRRALIVLAEKNVDFEFVNVDFMSAEQKQPHYKDRLPFGQIPLLEDGSFGLYESRAIARYIAARYAGRGTRLLPAQDDIQALGLFEQAASIEYSQFYDVALQVLVQKFFNPSKGIATDEVACEAAVKRLHSILDILNKILDSQDYFAGDYFSLVDTFYMPTVGHLFHAGEGAAFESLPNLKAWWDRVSARESWKKVAQH
ncbi:putative glutathione-S-transferase theta, GST [Colletotrichum karsti]|uniref:glutathione transferase n=1 Tax=Colletotrichum karsti TaxID=1095194 RepID=A0A9P6IGZ0_9PEZI|nr:putative glutathione-S-transferase theta, GST [Colletotrichum karsti]KAF9880461.1 putative glutathione-S-transferase theta, GST [Colletotrichum karsti]